MGNYSLFSKTWTTSPRGGNCCRRRPAGAGRRASHRAIQNGALHAPRGAGSNARDRPGCTCAPRSGGQPLATSSATVRTTSATPTALRHSSPKASTRCQVEVAPPRSRRRRPPPPPPPRCRRAARAGWRRTAGTWPSCTRRARAGRARASSAGRSRRRRGERWPRTRSAAWTVRTRSLAQPRHAQSTAGRRWRRPRRPGRKRRRSDARRARGRQSRRRARAAR